MDRKLTVLVGYDDCPAGHAAVLMAEDLAQRIGGDMLVVHAVPPVVPIETVGMATGGMPVPLELDARSTELRLDRERDELRTWLDGVLTTDMTCSITVREGPPAALIEDEARRVSPYVVVVGARSHGFGAALERALTSGSTTRRLEHDVEKQHAWPLLVVPA